MTLACCVHSFLRMGALAVLILSIVAIGFAKEPTDKPTKQAVHARVLGSPAYAVLNINNVTTWMRYDGHSNHSPAADDGMYFPRGTGSVVYQDNIVWGGKVFANAAKTVPGPRQIVRVGGGTYSIGTRAGRILNPSFGPVPGIGIEDPSSVDTRIWRIRRDHFTMSDAELVRDAASVNEIPESSLSEAQKSAVLGQYVEDWSFWPVYKGAPYVERNGIPGYQAPPAFSANFTVDSLISGHYDEPGVAGADPNQPADQVIWTVFNDLNVSTALGFEGSEPMGLEIQKTVWGYKRSDELGNLYFSRYRIINKGGVDADGATGDQFGEFWIDSMYVCQWSDPDVGGAVDDLIGCDTTLSLGYAYNVSDYDMEFRSFNLTPPSVGYLHVAGPLVNAPGDSGIYDLRRVHGRKNLGMSSFAYFSAGSPYTDPRGGTGAYLQGSGQWWKMLRGFSPSGDMYSADQPYAHPPGMAISKFPLSGDPVTSTGFVDGLGTSYSFGPGDRRIMLNSGPFSVAPNDTNEFVMATVAGIGADRLSSVAVMRSLARLTSTVYRSLWAQFPPAIVASMEFPAGQNPQVRLEATTSAPAPLTVEVKGRRANGTLLFSVSLFDDGAHKDGMASDGVFGAMASVPSGVSPLMTLEVTWEFADGTRNTSIKEVQLSLLPPPVASVSIVSDNLNNDGVANRGENLRLRLAFLPATFTLDSLTVKTLAGTPDDIFVERIDAAGGVSKTYDAQDPLSYLTVDVPAWYAESTLVVPVQISDRARNFWTTEVGVPVELQPLVVLASPVTKVQGPMSGLFGILRVNPTVIKNHTYRIEGSYDSVQQRSFITVRDLNEGGAVLLDTHEVPDSLGHNMPLIDGFKIVRGTVVIGGQGLMADAWTWNGTRFMTSTNTDPSRGFGFQEFGGAWGWETPLRYFTGSDNRVSPLQLSAVQMIFAAHDTTSAGPFGTNGGGELFDRTDDDTASYAYRYLRAASAAPAQPHFASWIVNTAGSGYLFQDYRISVPLAAYNIDANPPQRLAVAFMENNVAGGLVDGYYWPAYYSNVPGFDNTSATGPREWLWILNAPYGGPLSNGSYTTDILNDPNIPVMYWGLWNRWTRSRWSAGNSFTLTPHREISSNDMWTFNPSVTGVDEKNQSVPGSYELAQNYPNPFNPSTTIRYALPVTARVSLRVYNILGQLVDTILLAEQSAGSRELTWNADRHPSGVYIYRLEARGVDGSEHSQAMKMMLVK